MPPEYLSFALSSRTQPPVLSILREIGPSSLTNTSFQAWYRPFAYPTTSFVGTPCARSITVNQGSEIEALAFLPPECFIAVGNVVVGWGRSGNRCPPFSKPVFLTYPYPLLLVRTSIFLCLFIVVPAVQYIFTMLAHHLLKPFAFLRFFINHNDQQGDKKNRGQ